VAADTDASRSAYGGGVVANRTVPGSSSADASAAPTTCRQARSGTGAWITLLVSVLAPLTPVAGDELTVARLFEEPRLGGATVRLPRIAPDGSRVTFLRNADDDINRFDLWEYNVADGVTRRLVDARALEPEDAVLSDEEKARRERARVAAYSGIVEYAFSADATRLLFPIGGDVYLYDLSRSAEDATRRLTTSPATETDVRFSPGGRFVSFIREQNLFVIDLRDGRERQLTADGGGLIRNAMAEFVAQEEMGRSTGYWWSPDEQYIAFTRTDDAPVQEVNRYEIHADDLKVVPQRYPAAGTANVAIQLGVVAIGGGDDSPADVRWMQLGRNADIYLARVDWFPDSRHLAVQRQSRSQQALDLLKFDIASGEGRLLVSETSSTWIDLHDDIHFLADSAAFIWGSARTGYRHLYLYDNDGRLIRPLTAGDWTVAGRAVDDGLLAVDEARGLVYFSATRDGPLERHLYVTSLLTEDPRQVQRITREAGTHVIDFSRDASIYVDSFTNVDTPSRVSVHDSTGKRLAWLQENRLDSTHPFHPYRDGYRRPEFGELQSEDGQVLHYRLTRPADFDPSRRYPVLLYVYGGPHGQQVRNRWMGDDLTQLFARDGYVVFTLDNRGTSFRGTAFDAPLYQRMGQIEVSDQRVGVQFLRTLPYVDAQRVGVFGWSYGGYMTLMLMMQAPDLFAAGVSGAPVTDWRLYDTHYTERYMGDPQQDPAAYDASSVFGYIDALADPLLVVHGMADDNVLFTHSTRLFKELQNRRLPFEVMVYPGAKHGLLREDDAGVHALLTIKRFLDTHLKPEVSAP
jgi:dipeptidyl-peptidase-4